jgi:hypothetical protein
MGEIQNYPTGTPVPTAYIPYVEDPTGSPALKNSTVEDLPITAGQVSYTPAGATPTLSATDVQAAVTELHNEKADTTVLGDAAFVDIGTTAGTAAAGDHTHTGYVTGTGINAIVALTQAQYDALSPPSATTLYVING